MRYAIEFFNGQTRIFHGKSIWDILEKAGQIGLIKKATPLPEKGETI